jgi:phospholipid/cholesterol/gamma-HCH transport system substrate-binding protein
MRLTRIPVQIGRTIRGFVAPQRKVGRVPLGRTVIILELIAALIFLGYTLTKKEIRLPGTATPYQVRVEFQDAQGLDRQDEPGAAVAGAVLGRVTETHYEAGRAVATVTLDPQARGKVFADASAELRPASAIQNLIVNIDPGTPSAGPLPEGATIPSGRTTGFVALDQLTGIFDADTRAYTQILVGEAERGLAGRETDLRGALRKLGALSETATPISRSLATRRRLLTRLVDNLDTVMTTLGKRGVELGNAVAAGSDTLAVTAGREAELARATRELAPTLTQANRALGSSADLADILVPALDRIIPVSGGLADAMRKLRGLLPQTRSLVDQFDELTRKGAEPSRLFLKGTRGLKGKVRDEIGSAVDLARLTRLMNRYRKGGAQLADTLSGATSVNDRGGAYGQVDVLGLEPAKPENLGLPASAARSRGDRPSELDRKLAVALEEECKDNAAACILRFEIPGLPHQPLTVDGGGG